MATGIRSLSGSYSIGCERGMVVKKLVVPAISV